MAQEISKVMMKSVTRRQDANTIGLYDGKLPPQAKDLECAVLGAILLERDAMPVVAEFLSPEAFYDPRHQIIYEALREMFGKSEPIDYLSAAQRLRTMGKLEEVGGVAYLRELSQKVMSAAHIEHHARIILQKYVQRELIVISGKVIADAYDDTVDVFELLDRAESGLFEVTEKNLRNQYQSMGAVVQKTLHHIKKLALEPSGFTGVPSGFQALDRLTSGWQPSDLVILAARPGVGKTAFVLTIARNASIDFNKSVAIFSLEMSSDQLVQRMLSAEAEIESERLRRGELQPYEMEVLYKKADKLANAKIFIDDTPALNTFELRAKCRRLKKQHNIELVIIDYLQLMQVASDNKNRGGNREQEIGTISRTLKSIAKELNVPVIALSQLNRNVENRGGEKRPQLSDLRESGSIEQDADMVLMLYRQDYYPEKGKEIASHEEGKTELIILKNRHGATKDIEIKFIKQFTKFIDYSVQTPGYYNPEREEGNFKTFGSRMNEEDNGIKGINDGYDVIEPEEDAPF